MYLSTLKRINSFDNYILCVIRKYLQNRYLDILMPIVTSMGNLGAIWIIIAVIISAYNTQMKIGYMIILTLTISTIIGEGIVKNIVRRIRPCNPYNNFKILISRPLSYSFPSGHTLSSFAAAEVLSLYYFQYRFIFMGIAFLIALSRVYLYVHYPTDIVASVILSTLCAKLTLITLQSGYIEKILIILNTFLNFCLINSMYYKL